ncbi:MAG TPA: DUF2063 domain-containing protein [Roseobacter sp.]|uniref:Putative DNA-binding domain-containing protein n=1 Tax=marine sediment metagenome TaxID=412755 RepID=A0A0F9ND53_9ZZZZ|nr:DUF2063 domain-containing protein [Roseobacter sp.]HEC70786.1 DUF2063 domain-containing protein [Roseobacter sp.]
MTSLDSFRLGLLDPGYPAPAGLENGAHKAAGNRYDVYRNNVTHSLIAALRTAFPLVCKILGSKSFAGLAPAFVRSHPPRSPLMMHYGAEFPQFLANFPELSKFGFLSDCAKLDLAFRASYHAADSLSIDPTAFQTLPPDVVMQERLKLAPSTRVLRSRWPIFDIWRFNNVINAPKPTLQAQDVLITRPEFDPQPHLLPTGAASWLDRLGKGDTFGEAYDSALATTPEFDLSKSLIVAFQSAAFCKVQGL